MGHLWSTFFSSNMNNLIYITVLLPIVLTYKIHRDLPAECAYFTVGGCDPSKDEIIESYDIPNSAENVYSLCQQVCQIQEGCNFFKYNKNTEKCDLFHYRYLDSCQLVAGTATPSLDECAQELENTCNSFVREDCYYSGDVVFNKTSVTDSHSCQELLATLGFVYKAEYFVYDSDAHTCEFFTEKDSVCDILSGPVIPDLDGCNKDPTIPDTTAAPTNPPTSSAAPTNPPTSSAASTNSPTTAAP